MRGDGDGVEILPGPTVPQTDLLLVRTAHEVPVQVQRDVPRSVLQAELGRVAVDGVQEAATAAVAVNLPAVLELPEDNDQVALHVGAEIRAVGVRHIHVVVHDLVPESTRAGDDESVHEGEPVVAGHHLLLDYDPPAPRDTDHLGLVHQGDLLYEVLVCVEIYVESDLDTPLLLDELGEVGHHKLAVPLFQRVIPV